MPKVIQVIESEVQRGAGKNEDDPVRIVVQYHTLDGDLLAERDDWWAQKLLEAGQYSSLPEKIST